MLQRQPDPLVAGHRVRHPAAQVPDPVVGEQRVLHPRREHPAVGAVHRIAALGQRQTGPVGGVGEQRVLEEALAAGEQRHLRRDHGDGRNPVPEKLIEHRRRRSRHRR